MSLRKKELIYFVAFLLLIGASSCERKKTPEEIENATLAAALDKAKVDEQYKWVVILPSLGCHGCIQEGELFMKDNVAKSDVFFVLTKISSLKILQQKIGIKVAGRSNVYIDSANSFDIPTDNRIYPIIASVENGKLISHQFQSPKNGSAFKKLEALLSQ